MFQASDSDSAQNNTHIYFIFEIATIHSSVNSMLIKFEIFRLNFINLSVYRKYLEYIKYIRLSNISTFNFERKYLCILRKYLLIHIFEIPWNDISHVNIKIYPSLEYSYPYIAYWDIALNGLYYPHRALMRVRINGISNGPCVDYT